VEVNEALLNGPFFGNIYVKEATALLFAFLMGSIPVGSIVAWLFADYDGIDAPLAYRASHLLATNGVLFVDALKGLVPVAIVAHGAGHVMGVLAAFSAFAGHCFTPWLRLEGGKGFAVLLGALTALSWPAALMVAAVAVAAGVSSGHRSVGLLVALAVAPLPLWVFLGTSGAWLGLALLLAGAWRHRRNLVLIAEGREAPLRLPRLPERSSFARVERQRIQRVQIEYRDRTGSARLDDSALLKFE
jgi:glycerol-3-phosphate acyltransferase PlsY